MDAEERTYACGSCFDRIFILKTCEGQRHRHAATRGWHNPCEAHSVASPCSDCEAGRAVCAGQIFAWLYRRGFGGKPMLRKERLNDLDSYLAAYGTNARLIRDKLNQVIERERLAPADAI